MALETGGQKAPKRDDGGKVRLFAAMPLPNELLETALECQRLIARSSESCRLAKRESLHVTLAFLGDVLERDVQDVKDALQASCSLMQTPVRLEPERIGHFGSADDALLWLGLKKDRSLLRLARLLRIELKMRSIPFDEKEFVPHVTLARRAKLPAAIPSVLNAEGSTASTAVLYESRLSSDGARYRAIETFTLPSEGD